MQYLLQPISSCQYFGLLHYVHDIDLLCTKTLIGTNYVLIQISINLIFMGARMGKVLYFESRDDRLRTMLQTMNMVGLDITRSKSVDETCYWLQADKLRLISFDLLLLNELPAKDREREMLFGLADNYSRQ